MASITTETICRDLCGFLAESVLADGVAIETETELADLGVDSFSLVEIILFIERKFGVTLPEEELTPENLYSVETIAKCLKQRLPDA